MIQALKLHSACKHFTFKALRNKKEKFKIRRAIVSVRHLLSTLRTESSGKKAGKGREINLRGKENRTHAW